MQTRLVNAAIRYLPTLALVAATTAVATVRAPSPTERPTGFTNSTSELRINLGSDSTVLFTLDAQRAIRVDAHVGGRELSYDLRHCTLPSSLHVDSMELTRDDLRDDAYRGESFTLLFDVGSEADRQFGKLPRVQLSWLDGTLVAALITRQTSWTMGFSAELCNPAVRPHVSRRDVLPAPDANALVQELRKVPAALPATGDERPTDLLRRRIYDQLFVTTGSVRALARGFRDPEVEFRRNMALALGVLGGGWWTLDGTKVDISAALPELIMALNDPDSKVRSWAAQAIGDIGPNAAAAVPALLTLLPREDEGSRNSACIALRGIGPAASAALPALRKALSDPSNDVRRFAELAIESIGDGP